MNIHPPRVTTAHKPQYVRSTIDRADRATQLAQEKYGASDMQLYWTVGPHDLVAIAEMPDDETATAYGPYTPSIRAWVFPDHSTPRCGPPPVTCIRPCVGRTLGIGSRRELAAGEDGRKERGS